MSYIYGKVTNENGSSPLKEVEVTLQQGNTVIKKVITDSDGIWNFDSPETESGNAEVFFYKDGYGAAGFSAAGWNNGDNTELYKLETTVIPKWVYVVAIAGIAIGLFFYFKNRK